MSTSYPPTAEQAACIAAFRTGQPLVIEAGAGSGKTSTLRMLADAEPHRRGIYIAYNKAIATDAERSFPRNVACSTAHSLAYRAIGRNYRQRLNAPRLPARETARILGITGPVRVSHERMLAPHQIARIAMEAVGRFCNSASNEPSPRHIGAYAGVDDEESLSALRTAVYPLLVKAWRDLANIEGRLKFQHDHYLKLWQLSDPQLAADVVYLDEAQDANPVIASVVERQRNAQRVLVGDRCQAIYGWRGAVDAMSAFQGTRLPLSQSFRFGPAIADEANKWLRALTSPLTLTGYDAIPSQLAPAPQADAVLCRSNAQAIAQVMQAQIAGRRAALVGGGKEIRSLAEAAASLKAGAGTGHPELFVFQTWGEVQDYAENDAAGADIKVLVKLVDEHGPEAIMAAMDRLSDERYADLVVSTAHKAKGREWGSVRIANDFREPDEDSQVDPAEAMLAYVAVTRARLNLDRTGLAWIDSYLDREMFTGTKEEALTS